MKRIDRIGLEKTCIEDLDISAALDLDVKISVAVDREDHVLRLRTPDGILCETAEVQMDLDDEIVYIELHSAHGIGDITLTMPLDTWDKIVLAIFHKIRKRGE